MNIEDIKAALSSGNAETLKHAAEKNQVHINSSDDLKIIGSLVGDIQDETLLDLLDPLVSPPTSLDHIYLYAIDQALQAKRFEHATLLARRSVLRDENTKLNNDLWEIYINRARMPQEKDFMKTHKGFQQLIERNFVSLFRAIRYPKAFEALLEGGADASALNENGESLSYAILGSPASTGAKHELLDMLTKERISIEPCREFSISPAFYCVKLGHDNLFEYFTIFPGLEKVKTPAGENIVHYISRYDHANLVQLIPKEYLVPLFAEQDASGVFALERFVMCNVKGDAKVHEAYLCAFKEVIRQGKKMQHYNRVVDYLGKDLVPYLLDEIALETKQGEIPWFNETSFKMSEMPQEIIQLVCDHLPLNDVMELSCVSKSIKITTNMLRNCLIKYKPSLKLEQISNWHKKFAQEAQLYNNWMKGHYQRCEFNRNRRLYRYLDLDENWLVIWQHQMTRSVLVLWNCAKKQLLETDCVLRETLSMCFLESTPNNPPKIAFYDGYEVKLYHCGKINAVPIIGVQKNRRLALTVQAVAANILLFDGIVWDLDSNQALHKFKKENESYNWSYCYNKFTHQYIIQVDNGVLDIYNKDFVFMKRIQFSEGGRSEVRVRMAVDDNIILFHSTQEDFTLDLLTLQQQPVVQTKLLKDPHYHNLTRVIEADGSLFQLVDQKTKQHSHTYTLSWHSSHERSAPAVANSRFLFFEREYTYYDFT